jgi:4-amino-4-deoxy-L-arabinose transferase
LLTFGCFLIAVPWFVYIINVFPKEAKWVIHKFLFAYSDLIEGHSAPFWYYINYVEILYGEFVYVPLIFAFYYMFKHKNEWALKLLATWWILPVLIFSLAETKRHTYILLASPAFFIITAWYFFYLKETLWNKRFVIAKYITLILIIGLPIRLTIERIKPFEQRDQNPVWAENLRMLKYQIPEKKVVLLNTEHYIEAMFYTNFIAYPSSPDSLTIRKLILEGYTVYQYQGQSFTKLALSKF